MLLLFFIFFRSLSHTPTWSLEVDTDYGVVMGCLLPSELPWDPVVVAPAEQLLTQLFFLGDRDEQSSSPANRGKHTPSFYPAENLDNGLIDQRVLKQRWGCWLLNILKPNDICLCILRFHLFRCISKAETFRFAARESFIKWWRDLVKGDDENLWALYWKSEVLRWYQASFKCMLRRKKISLS